MADLATLSVKVTADGVEATKNKLNELSGGANKARTATERLNSAFHDLRNAFVAAFAIHEVVRFVGALVHANVEMQRIKFTMAQAFGQGATSQFQFVSALSEKLGLNLQAAAQGFAALGAAAQGTGIQASTIRNVFKGVSEAATVLHSSTEQVNSIFIQLSQAMSLGKLQMQDIRAISQNLPGTMVLLSETAKRMGTTLTAALASGGLEAKKFLNIFGNVLQERFGAQAASASHSLNAELNRLHTTLFSLTAGSGTFEQSFASAIRGLVDTLNQPSVKEGFESLITSLGVIAGLVIKIGAGFGTMTAALTHGIADAAAHMTGVPVLGNTSASEISALQAQIKSLQGSRLRPANRTPIRQQVIAQQVAKLQSEIAVLQSFNHPASGGASSNAPTTGAGSASHKATALTAAQNQMLFGNAEGLRSTTTTLGATTPVLSANMPILGIGATQFTNAQQLKQMADEQKAAAKQVYDNYYGPLQQMAIEAARNIQDAFATFLFDPFNGGLKGMLKSFANTLRQMAAQALATQIFKATGLSSWLGTALNVGGTAAAGATGGSATAHASGGFAPGGQLALVGERGPELFVPSTGGNIIPNNQLGKLGNSVNVNIDARGAGPDETAKLMAMRNDILSTVRGQTEFRLQRGAWASNRA